MATVADYAGPLAPICTPVPPAGDGVCDVCHGVPRPGYTTCWSCPDAMRQVSQPCSRVVPVSLYEIPSQLHQELAGYKRSHDQAVRARSSLRVISILCHFLRLHRSCIAESAGGDWSTITGVPSSTGRGTEHHPLISALQRVPAVYEEYEDLLQRGPAPIRHNKASDTGYVARRPLSGERVLVIDDTFTSGARSQSAASTLALAGAEVVAIVVVGRVINPGFTATTRAFWEERRSQHFSFDTCCIHPQTP